jgi:hypothetical protein
MKTNDLNQVKDSEPDSDSTTNQTKKSLKHTHLEWNEQLAENIIKQWLMKHSSYPVATFMFLEFFKGRKDNFSIDFDNEISDANLVRIGFMLGLDYKQMNIIFKRYRTRYNRKAPLSSNYCPKTKQQFFNGGTIVKDLQNTLKDLGYPYIYEAQSNEEKERDLSILIQDERIELNEIDRQKLQIENRINKLKILIEKIKESQG